MSRPKLGKSWLMLDVSVAIATGRTTLGTLQPETGDVLYLALDDGERRLQLRLAALLKREKTWPARLALATRWRRANDGGLSDIDAWYQSVANPVAVVIDSLDRFRSLQGGESAQVYDAIEKLQRIARDRRSRSSWSTTNAGAAAAILWIQSACWRPAAPSRIRSCF